MKNYYLVTDFLDRYQKHFSGVANRNSFLPPFHPGINQAYYEIDLRTKFIRKAIGMEYLGLISKSFDLKKSIEIIHPSIQELIIRIKIEAYKVLRDAVQNEEITKESFLQAMFFVNFPIQYYVGENEFVYVSVNQRIKVAEYDESLNVRVKSVEMNIDPLLTIEGFDALELSSQINYAFYDSQGKKITQLNNRLKKRVYVSLFGESHDLFPGKMGEVVACYLETGLNASAGQVAEELNIQRAGVRKHHIKIKEHAQALLERVLPGAQMNSNVLEVKQYLKVLMNLGIL